MLPLWKGSANALNRPLILTRMHLIDVSPLGKQRQQIQVNAPEDWEAWLSALTQPRPKHRHLQKYKEKLQDSLENTIIHPK